LFYRSRGGLAIAFLIWQSASEIIAVLSKLQYIARYLWNTNG
jgi:hypothetical protein